MSLILNNFTKLFVVSAVMHVVAYSANLQELRECGLAVFTRNGGFYYNPYGFNCLGQRSESLQHVAVPLIATEVLNPEAVLQKIHEQWKELGRRNIYGDYANKQGIINDYERCIREICVSADLMGHWNEHNRDQLLCYKFSMLIGCANVYGVNRDNPKQFKRALMAYDTLLQLGGDVTGAYVDGTNLVLAATMETAIRTMTRALEYWHAQAPERQVALDTLRGRIQSNSFISSGRLERLAADLRTLAR